jgi:acyl carrier protein
MKENKFMRQKIIRIMSKVLGVDCLADENPSQKSLTSWDSLRHLNLIIELETEFDISFEPEEIAEMTSLSVIESLIESHNDK